MNKKTTCISLEKLNILYIIPRSDEIGGAHVHVRDMAAYVISKGGKANVLVGGNGIYCDLLEEANITFKSIPKLGRSISLFRDIQAALALHKEIRLLSPDIISCHSAKAGVLVRSLGFFTNLPTTIFTAHGWAFSVNSSKIKSFVYFWIEKILAIKSKTIITVCESDRQLAIAKNLCIADKIITIHNGMPERLTLTSNSDKSLSTNNATTIKLLTIARFEAQKDFKTLFSALSNLKHLDWSLTLIGGGDSSEYEKMAINCGISKRCNFVGRSINVVKYLALADIFILSSHWEGFPRSILEAMRSKLPIIATDVGGVRESVINQFNGFTIPHLSVESLTEAIEKLILDSDLRLMMSLRSEELFKSKFTFNQMAEKNIQLYLKSITSHS